MSRMSCNTVPWSPLVVGDATQVQFFSGWAFWSLYSSSSPVATCLSCLHLCVLCLETSHLGEYGEGEVFCWAVDD